MHESQAIWWNKGFAWKKNPPSFLNSHFITSSVLPAFLQQIRTGKIYTDYAPSDTLYTCFFPPNLHVIHAIVFEAVTGWEIFEVVFIINMYSFLGMCFGEAALCTKVSHQWMLKKPTTRNMWFYCLPRYLFLHRRLPVTWSAVVCVYIFWLHFFCNYVLRMPHMDLKIQQYNK